MPENAKKPRKKRKPVAWRDASSGQYVSPEEAKANPDTTIAETEGLTKSERAVVEAAKEAREELFLVDWRQSETLPRLVKAIDALDQAESGKR